jgi:ferredoxin
MDANRSASGDDLLPRLRAALADEALHVVVPVSASRLRDAGLLDQISGLLPRVAGGILIGDGGGAFFRRFEGEGDRGAADPLDRHTERAVERAVQRALAGMECAHRIVHPFGEAPPFLPFARLGAAGGVPPAGPLGLQVHPTFGPWWAYRAFVLLSAPVPDEPPMPSACVGCSAPCVDACPAEAVRPDGFAVGRCLERRLASASPCGLVCDARDRCVVGPAHRYPAPQVRYHMEASLRLALRRR